MCVFILSITTAVGSTAQAQTSSDELRQYLRVGGPLDDRNPAEQTLTQPTHRQLHYSQSLPAPLQPVSSYSSAVPVNPGKKAPATPLKVPDTFFRAIQTMTKQEASQNVPKTFVQPPPIAQRAAAPATYRQVPLAVQKAPVPGEAAADMPTRAYQPVTIQTATQTRISGNTATESNKGSILSTDYLLSYPQNAWRIISAPVNFDTNDWLIAGGVTAATGLLMLADKGINDTWRDDIHSGTLDDFLDAIEHFGDSQTVLIAAGAGYMLGELVGTERDKEAALLVAQSFLLSAGLTQGLKMTFKRERPDDSRDDQFSFFSSDASDTNSAFPSGHATNAFSMATVLSNVYKTDAPWLGWVLYPTATLTSLARVNNERHWASDVFFGGALGYFIGRMVVRYSPFRDNDRISLLPMSDGDYNGLRVVHRL